MGTNLDYDYREKWAKERGLKLSKNNRPCTRELFGKRCSRDCDCTSGDVARYFDHCERWIRNKKVVCITAHNYHVGDKPSRT